MAKLPVLSGRRICAILTAHGYVQVRQRGSHIVMQAKFGSGTRTVIVPDHSEIKPGTMASIIRQSGLAREEFET